MPPKKSNNNDNVDNDNVDNDDNDNNKPVHKSKRGRPPIQKTQPVKPKKNNSVNHEEELVLHLPVFDDDITDAKNIFTMRDTESSSNSFDESTITEIEKKTDINHLIEEIEKRDASIKNLKDTIKNFKNISQENILTITKETKKILVNIGLISLDTNKLQYCEKTSIACWHCTHTFDSVPLFLPEKYHNGKFYVFGNFCTWSCMLAYNNQIDEYRKQIRNSLIKK